MFHFAYIYIEPGNCCRNKRDLITYHLVKHHIIHSQVNSFPLMGLSRRRRRRRLHCWRRRYGWAWKSPWRLIIQFSSLVNTPPNNTLEAQMTMNIFNQLFDAWILQSVAYCPVSFFYIYMLLSAMRNMRFICCCIDQNIQYTKTPITFRVQCLGKRFVALEIACLRFSVKITYT